MWVPCGPKETQAEAVPGGEHGHVTAAGIQARQQVKDQETPFLIFSSHLLPAALQVWSLGATCSSDFSFFPMDVRRACKASGRGPWVPGVGAQDTAGAPLGPVPSIS